MSAFKLYSDAKEEAEKMVKKLSEGSHVTALTASESMDALAAVERLEAFRQKHGKTFGLLSAVSHFVEAMERLNGRTIAEAVDGFLQMLVSVKRIDLKAAVEEFLLNRKPRTEAKEGKRSQISRDYERHVSGWLTKFAATFPNTSVNELTKNHLNVYMKAFGELSTKSRNDRRNTVKMFLNWAIKKDYLPLNHRLFEAEAMSKETVDASDIDFYRPEELAKLLKDVPAEFVPVLALGGLAGLRMIEIMRLDWSDVWRVEGQIEIIARNAKTRQRRLIEICPRLAELLAPYRDKKGKIWVGNPNRFYLEFPDILKKLEIPSRRNAFRHAFCTYHYALHANENLTAQQGGNSPAMIHAHYKGLATKADAEKWFGVVNKLVPS